MLDAYAMQYAIVHVRRTHVNRVCACLCSLCAVRSVSRRVLRSELAICHKCRKKRYKILMIGACFSCAVVGMNGTQSLDDDVIQSRISFRSLKVCNIDG